MTLDECLRTVSIPFDDSYLEPVPPYLGLVDFKLPFYLFVGAIGDRWVGLRIDDIPKQ